MEIDLNTVCNKEMKKEINRKKIRENLRSKKEMHQMKQRTNLMEIF